MDGESRKATTTPGDARREILLHARLAAHLVRCEQHRIDVLFLAKPADELEKWRHDLASIRAGLDAAMEQLAHIQAIGRGR